MNYAIGIDIGGTNVKGLAVSPNGKVLAEARASTGIARWTASVRRVLKQLNQEVGKPPACVGLAAPGLASNDQRSIANLPGRLPGLEGLVWEDFLRLNHPVPVLNDAHAALLGETWRGAARGAQNAILLTLGTGVGGAVMVDGRLLRGHLGRAGHLGHISLDPRGTPDIVNTPGSLEQAIGDYTMAERSGGRFKSTRALVKAGGDGDAEARRIWLDSVRALAAGVASLINVLDPELVVVGGGISKAGPALFRPLAKFLDEFEWRPGDAKVHVAPAKLGDRAGAFGAAWHAITQKAL